MSRTETLDKARTTLAVAQRCTETGLTENDTSKLLPLPVLLGIVADYLDILDDIED